VLSLKAAVNKASLSNLSKRYDGCATAQPSYLFDVLISGNFRKSAHQK